MADLYAPEQQDQPTVDPRLLRGALKSVSPDIFSPPAVTSGGGDIYGSPTPARASAGSDRPDIYGSKPNSPVAGMLDGGSDEIYSAPRHLASLGPAPAVDPHKSYYANRKAMEKWNADRQLAEQEDQMEIEAGRNRAIAGMYGARTGLYNAQAAAGGFRPLPNRESIAALAQTAFTDPNTGQIDRDALQSWLKSRSARVGAMPTKPVKNDDGTITYHQFNPADQSWSDTGLVVPPPNVSFQAVDTDRGVAPFNTRTGALGTPTPGTHRVAPQPNAPTPGQQVKTLGDIERIASQEFPLFDAQGKPSDDQTRVNYYRRVGELQRKYLAPQPAAAPAAGPSAAPSRTVIAPPPVNKPKRDPNAPNGGYKMGEVSDDGKFQLTPNGWKPVGQ